MIFVCVRLYVNSMELIARDYLYCILYSMTWTARQL